MPKPATAEEEKTLEVTLPEETIRPDMPLVRARVVYLGANPKCSITLPGTIRVDRMENPEGAHEGEDVERDPAGRIVIGANGRPKTRKIRYDEVREAVDVGLQCYDFTTHDTRGRLQTSRLMPEAPDVPANMRGKPFVWCEHLGHLREFFLGPPDPRTKKRVREFAVRCRPEDMQLLRDHIRRSERGRRQQEALFQEVTA